MAEEQKSAAARNQAIYITRAIVPDAKEYTAAVEEILTSRNLTNMGSFAVRLEKALTEYLKVPYTTLTTNGTIALQLAIRAAKLKGREIITTPFSYVATVSTILWEGFTPVFADIDEENFCLDPKNIDPLVTEDTCAIMPVHIYGNACDVEGLEQAAKRHDLRTIYDAAQCFGVRYKGKSLFEYGDFSTASFHATKVFHTVEGGAVFCRHKEEKDHLDLLRAFGHKGDDHFTLGINAKITEPNAAMGLCLLPRATENIAARGAVAAMYDALLPASGVRKPSRRPNLDYNNSYYPLVFDDPKAVNRAIARMKEHNIHPRRYFYPALNTLPYLTRTNPCPVAENICMRVLCLPLFAELGEENVERIMGIVKESL